MARTKGSKNKPKQTQAVPPSGQEQRPNPFNTAGVPFTNRPPVASPLESGKPIVKLQGDANHHMFGFSTIEEAKALAALIGKVEGPFEPEWQRVSQIVTNDGALEYRQWLIRLPDNPATHNVGLLLRDVESFGQQMGYEMIRKDVGV